MYPVKLASFVFVFCAIPALVQADSTGPLSPSTVTVTTAGSYSWTNLNATSQASIDGDSASIAISGSGATSDEVFLSGFGAAVPSGATISGIAMTFEFATTGMGGVDDEVTLNVGSIATPGTPKVLDLADTGGAFFPATIGDFADLWGLTLTPAIVNDPGFGIFSEITTVNSGTESLDLTSIEIFYHADGTPTVDGGRGPLEVHEPASYDSSTETPLVLFLHGYGSNGFESGDSYFNLDALVDEFGFLFVHPHGRIENGGDSNRYWSATQACCNFHGGADDDTTYLLGVIDAMKAAYNVDADRVYLIGHSNGGFMSYRMACTHADVIAGIASLAGATFFDPNDCTPSEPVHILQIHGTNDGTILYAGGQTYSDPPGGDYPGAIATVEQWATKNGCSLVADFSASNIDLESGLSGDESGVVRYLGTCDDGGAVELWSIFNGGHVPSFSSTFSRQIIEFLYDHPKGSDVPSDIVYVDFDNGGAESGTGDQPWNSLGEAVTDVASGGAIWIDGSSADVATGETFAGGSAINKNVTIRANPTSGSGVSIGPSGARNGSAKPEFGFIARPH